MIPKGRSPCALSARNAYPENTSSTKKPAPLTLPARRTTLRNQQPSTLLYCNATSGPSSAATMPASIKIDRHFGTSSIATDSATAKRYCCKSDVATNKKSRYAKQTEGLLMHRPSRQQRSKIDSNDADKPQFAADPSHQHRSRGSCTGGADNHKGQGQGGEIR